MEELWRDIKDYEGYYQISTLGNIKAISNLPRSNRKIWKTGKGYCSVNITNTKGTKKFTIHRLVAVTFIPNPNNYPCINHIDGNKDNNELSNLEWCTHSENIYHSYKYLNRKAQSRKLDKAKALIIRKLKFNHSVKEIAKMFNVTNDAIYAIINNKSYK